MSDDTLLLIGKVAAYFSLGDVIEYHQLGGLANTNYSLRTRQGKYVAKIITRRTLTDLQQETSYLTRLYEAKYPSSRYLPAPEGSFAYQDDDTIAVVSPHLQGDIPSRSPQICKAVGKYLARLHSLSSDLLPTTNHWLRPAYLPHALDLARNHFGQEVAPYVQAFQELGDFHPEQLPQTIIHGDLAPDNCLFVGDQLSAILDWEEVGIGAALLDFAMCASQFCLVSASDPERSQIDSGLFQYLLAGYTQERTFSPLEYTQIESAMKYVGLTISVWMWLQFGIYHPNLDLLQYRFFYWDVALDQWRMP